MRKLTTALFCLALFLFSAHSAQAADLWPIEKTPWGMSRAEVIKVLGMSEKEAAPTDINKDKPAEQQPIELINEKITADGKTYPLKDVRYLFIGNGLTHISIWFKLPEGRDEAQKAARDLYAEYSKILNGLYGEPLQDNEEFRSKTGEYFTYTYIWKRDATTWVHLCRIEDTKYKSTLLNILYVRPYKYQYAQALAGKEKAFDEGMRKRIAAIAEKTQRPLQGEWKMTLSTVSKKLVRAEYRCKTNLDSQQSAFAHQDAMQIVTAMALQMVDLGINPGKEDITIRMRVYYSGKGLTGKQLTREYGEAIYDPEKDRVDLEPPEMKRLRESMRQ